MQGTGITEVHIVGGVHPDHTLDSYCEMIRRVKRALPDVAIKAYTAVEILYMIRNAGLDLETGMRRLIEAGMESIPGGGAEIFDEELRAKLCPEKCSSKEWLEVHAMAHKLGISTNCTMLYGHVESIEQRVDHLDRLRRLQDEAPGFNAFIPLKYRSRNNRMSEIGECSVEEDMRTIAMSRIFLDNIPHIKAYWVAYGKSVTEMALAFGADDIDGTIDDSTKIYSMAGADSRPSMSVSELEALVHDAGFVAVERDTHYREVCREKDAENND
jgi:aminodeoxyfutalosine synthase